MGLTGNDAMPRGIKARDAYGAIRKWYTNNARTLLERPPTEQRRDFRPAIRESLPLIDILPAEGGLSDLEMRVVLSEVILGKLEWGYHETDGRHKMAAYAHAALETLGLGHVLSGDEKKGLRDSGSRLLPYLSSHIID